MTSTGWPWSAVCLSAALFLGTTPLSADTALEGEIEYLLARVNNSSYVFVRNGDDHDSADAARHMRRKYEHFDDKGRIQSIDDFIELAATKSMITGKPYMVRFPDGSEMPTAEWLRNEIDAFRANDGAAER